MKLLREMHADRVAKREPLRACVREKLRRALSTLLPGSEVVLFGSITQHGAFHQKSDVDLAVMALPAGCSLYGLIAILEEELERSVDVLVLNETRLREKILAEGERWTV